MSCFFALGLFFLGDSAGGAGAGGAASAGDASAGAGAGAGASASACTGFSVGCVWPSDLLHNTSKGIFFKAGCRNS